MSSQVCSSFLWPEDRHDRQEMLGTASVDEELIMEVGSFVTLCLVGNINGEVFPVSLHCVVTKSINIVILRLLTISLIPTSLIGVAIVRNETFGLIFLLLWCSKQGSICFIPKSHY